MGRTKAQADASHNERINFTTRKITIPNTTLPPFDVPEEEMTIAELFAFVRKCRGAAELFPAKVAKAEA